MPTVLIVEDDAIVADIYRLALERRGYRVVLAKDGIDGLEQAATAAPDFIFLDIRMPRMDGIEALRRKAADPALAAIPTVIMSNYDDPGLVRASRELGARDYLVKAGTNPSDLPAVVERWISKSDA